jgi:hypothetical protein
MFIPGGFVLLLGWGLGRALRFSWQLAAQNAQGGRVPMRQVLAGLTVRDIVRQALP